MRSVDVMLDKPRHLRYTLPLLRDLERDVRVLLGLPLDEAMNRWFVTIAPLLVYHGLRHEDRKLTLERTEALLQNQIDADVDLAGIYERAQIALRLSGVLGKGPATRAADQLDKLLEKERGETPDEPEAPADPLPETD